MNSLLSIIGTSYIDAPQRLDWASRSLESLRESAPNVRSFISLEYPYREKRFLPFKIPNRKLADQAVKLYQNHEVYWDWTRKRSSVEGLRVALERSIKEESICAFIHLDDNVYVKDLGKLLQYAEHSLANHDDLMAVKLTGYPMLTKTTDTSLGNRCFIEEEGRCIRSGAIRWEPRDQTDYTLWVCDIEESYREKMFWPLGLWLAVYRSEFLLDLLEVACRREFRHLWEIEKYLHSKENYRNLGMDRGSKVGVINLQFGGTEMEKKPNWKELLSSPNSPIR